MNKWFFINGIIVMVASWKVLIGPTSTHIVLGFIGLICIIHNWTRHAIFSSIRSGIKRSKKIKYASITKKFGWLHKWVGSTALIIILLHGFTVLQLYPFQWTNVKLISGLIAIILLFFVVLFGWLRFIRTTVKRRFIHWGLAYSLIFVVIIHLLL